MGTYDSVDLDQALEHKEPNAQEGVGASSLGRGSLLVFIAALVFLVNIVAPPHLMDDVDAVQAQVARNMLTSGDWTTARLDGVPYLEKSPMIYWMMAVSF